MIHTLRFIANHIFFEKTTSNKQTLTHTVKGVKWISKADRLKSKIPHCTKVFSYSRWLIIFGWVFIRFVQMSRCIFLSISVKTSRQEQRILRILVDCPILRLYLEKIGKWDIMKFDVWFASFIDDVRLHPKTENWSVISEVW